MASFEARIAPYLEQVMGLPYVWGGKSPAAGGFDCSGFVSWLYAMAFGIPLRSPVTTMYTQTEPTSSPRRGDLVFWDVHSDAQVQHVGIYWQPGVVLDSRGGQGIGYHSIYGSPEYRRVPGLDTGGSGFVGNSGQLILVALAGLALLLLD